MRRPHIAGAATTAPARKAIATFAAVGLLPLTTAAATAVPHVRTNAESSAGRSASFDVAMVTDLNAGPAGSLPDSLTAAHGSVYFSATTPDLGYEPWVSDGTGAGTRLVADIVPGRESSFLREVTSTAGATILALDDRGAVPSGPWTGTLWATTTTGPADGATTLLKEGPLLSTDSVRFGDDALLHLSDFAEAGAQLWRTDGTPDGTRLVKDGLILGINLNSADDHVFFTDAQQTLMVTDGTTAGTRRLHTWTVGPHGSTLVMGIDTAGGKAFLDIDDTYAEGAEMWISDGTRDGTRLLKDINPGPASAHPGQLTPLKRRMFFVVNDGRHDREVWRSDGTTATTLRVTNLRSRGVWNLTACRGRVYFTTVDEDSATLWRTRGEPGRYSRVATLPGNTDARPTTLTCISEGVAFVADDGVHGRELWTLADGTRRAVLHDLQPGGPSSRPSAFTRVGTRLFLVADDGTHGRELWMVTSEGR